MAYLDKCREPLQSRSRRRIDSRCTTTSYRVVDNRSNIEALLGACTRCCRHEAEQSLYSTYCTTVEAALLHFAVPVSPLGTVLKVLVQRMLDVDRKWLPYKDVQYPRVQYSETRPRCEGDTEV